MNEWRDELKILEEVYKNALIVDYEFRSMVYIFEDEPEMYLKVLIPKKYPKKSVTCEIGCGDLPENSKIEIMKIIIEFADNHIGENVLFDLINVFQESIMTHKKRLLSVPHNISDKADEITDAINYSLNGGKLDSSQSLKEVLTDYFRPESPLIEKFVEEAKEKNIAKDLYIISGEKIKIKKSVFQAHYANISELDDVQKTMDKLLLDDKIANATHNICVYKLEYFNFILFL